MRAARSRVSAAISVRMALPNGGRRWGCTNAPRWVPSVMHHQPPVHSTSVSVLAGRIGIEEVETAVLRRDLARRTGPYAFPPLSGVHAAFVVRAETPAASGSTPQPSRRR